MCDHATIRGSLEELAAFTKSSLASCMFPLNDAALAQHKVTTRRVFIRRQRFLCQLGCAGRVPARQRSLGLVDLLLRLLIACEHYIRRSLRRELDLAGLLPDLVHVEIVQPVRERVLQPGILFFEQL